MPLADFSGSRNWGYDGVLWYAPDSAYGRPDDLKTLIDEAHLRGLMVFLDVVYNHFGPEGNYLGRYAPSFFTEAQTPWGSAIDYRGAGSARLRHRQRAVLVARVPLRRVAARRRACHRRTRRSFRCCMSSAAPSAISPSRPAATSIWCWKTTTTPPACWIRAGSTAGQLPRAVERRLSSCLARAADAGKPRLLRRLCDIAAAGHCAGAGIRFRLSGRSLRASRRSAARRAQRRARANRLRQLPAEPRPDRQSRARRPA